MGNVTVIGAQWGDEGKGKIVDWLASRAVRPEPVEGLSFSRCWMEEGQGFDKLSPNGTGKIRSSGRRVGLPGANLL